MRANAMRAIWIAGVVGVLVGCATLPAQQARRPPPVPGPTPVCTFDRQCAEMWMAARQAAELVSGMRIRIFTDTFMETFVPRQSYMPAVAVTKYPIGQDSYEIRAEMQCRGRCGDVGESGMALFNNLVTSAGIGVRKPGNP